MGAAATLTFLGGVDTVTGSKTLLDTPSGRVLVDCGLFQGLKQFRLRNWDPFPEPPESISAVLLTHAHVDHCGYLPRLARSGFAGPVHATDGTAKLARIVLPDSGHLHEEQAEHANRRGYSKHRPALPLYTEQDAEDSLRLLHPIEFGERREILPGVSATWRRAGHILGAASIHLDVDTGRGVRRIVFSGDLGRPNHPLLLPPDPIGPADVVITESTYGDEDHAHDDPDAAIADAVNGAARRGGVVVIPAFAVDRTEIVLWHLDRLVATGQVPDVRVFVDSPMASRALAVYAAEAREGSAEVRPELRGRELFPDLRVTEVPTADESKQLNARRGPFIIVSASGMATGGRVVHHLANRLGSDRNVVVLVGFQAPGTRGDALANGARTLRMFGHDHPVRARVISVPLSAHADRTELGDWVGTTSERPDVVYVNHGEPDASSALVAHLTAAGIRAIVPEHGQAVTIS